MRARSKVRIHDEPKWWIHSQDLLKEERRPESKLMFHRRAWLHFSYPTYEPECVGIEVLFSRHPRFLLSLDVGKAYAADNTFCFSLSLIFLSIYLSVEWPWLEKTKFWTWWTEEDKTEVPATWDKTKTMMKQHARHIEYRLSIHDWAIWWSFGNECGGNYWSPRKLGAWREANFQILDIFFGKMTFKREVLEERDVKIPMPEKEYDAHVTIYRAIRKRPRWFGTRDVHSNVEIPEGIPIPGKGTTSYNCDDDAVFAMGCSAVNISEAIAEVVKSVTYDRLRYPL